MSVVLVPADALSGIGTTITSIGDVGALTTVQSAL
jgi:hypothetical protein